MAVKQRREKDQDSIFYMRRGCGQPLLLRIWLFFFRLGVRLVIVLSLGLQVYK